MGLQAHRHAAFFCLVFPLLRTSGKDEAMKGIPKTPVEFDYDLWTTEDGKCMVRIKSTGEVTEVDREVMKALRAEEKWMRRKMTGAPVPGAEEATATVLSLDFVSFEGGEDMSPAWLEDPHDYMDEVIMKQLEQDFLKTLTAKEKGMCTSTAFRAVRVNSSMQRSPACLHLACASLSVRSEKKQKIFSEGVPSFCVPMSVVG